MMKYLQEVIQKREQIGKYYIAIVEWILPNSPLKIESYIGRHPTEKIKMTTKNPINPKIAISFVKVLWYIDNKYSLLEVKIETGRTHQIRVHLSNIWYPIIWDTVYGNKKTNEEVWKKYNLQRQALHAYKIEIELYGKKREFIAPLKTDMKKIIKLLPY
jgi:23S rRNA pseudouridine1911/1915/1917 synthase